MNTLCGLKWKQGRIFTSLLLGMAVVHSLASPLADRGEPALASGARQISENTKVGASRPRRRAFFAEAGSFVHISIDIGTEEDPCSAKIALYAPDGRLLAREWDTVNKVLPFTGRYTVRIDGCTEGLRIQILPPPPPDEYEPDESAVTARLLPTDGGSQFHTLHTPLDQDWVTFYVIEEQILTVETFRLRNDCDTILTLYDVDLNQVAVSDDYAGEERSLIRVLISRTGQYFARVHHRAGRGDEGKSYHLRARLETPVYGGTLRAPRQVTFPEVRSGSSFDRPIQLTNLHSSEVLRLSVQALEGPFAADLPPGEVVLLPRQSRRFQVRFAPTARGPVTGRLVMTTTDPDRPTVVINHSGRGI